MLHLDFMLWTPTCISQNTRSSSYMMMRRYFMLNTTIFFLISLTFFFIFIERVELNAVGLLVDKFI